MTITAELDEIYRKLRKLSKLNTRIHNIEKVRNDTLLNSHIDTSVYPAIIKITGEKLEL